MRLKHLIGIMVPGVRSIESFYLVLLTILLLARTVLSIRVAEVMGSNAQSLVEMNLKKFVRGVLALGAIAIPASVVNSLLKYFTNMLSIRFRKRLSLHVHEKYLDGITFYKASMGNNIDNIDQRITQDIDQFATNISSLYATTFKPVVDIGTRSFFWSLIFCLPRHFLSSKDSNIMCFSLNTTILTHTLLPSHGH